MFSLILILPSLMIYDTESTTNFKWVSPRGKYCSNSLPLIHGILRGSVRVPLIFYYWHSEWVDLVMFSKKTFLGLHIILSTHIPKKLLLFFLCDCKCLRIKDKKSWKVDSEVVWLSWWNLPWHYLLIVMSCVLIQRDDDNNEIERYNNLLGNRECTILGSKLLQGDSHWTAAFDIFANWPLRVRWFDFCRSLLGNWLWVWSIQQCKYLPIKLAKLKKNPWGGPRSADRLTYPVKILMTQSVLLPEDIREVSKPKYLTKGRMDTAASFSWRWNGNEIQTST